MNPLFKIALLTWLSMQAAAATELLPGLSDNVTCYQHGTPILRTQNRIREFVPTESMKLLVDVNLGQVSETHVRIYASTLGEVTCVLTSQK